MDQEGLKHAFGQRVRSYREARGLSQEQLATLIERSVDTISHIERGTNSTRLETAWKLADALGVHLPDLFELGATDSLGRSRRQRITDLSMQLAGLSDAQFAQAAEIIERVVQLAAAANL